MRNHQLRLVTAAYDSRPAYRGRRAWDQGDPLPTARRDQRREEDGDFGRDQDDGLDEVKAFIKANMDPAAFAKLEAMLEALGGDPDDDSNHREDPEPPPLPPNGGDRRNGRDSPPSFRGMPQPGGTKFGQDSRGNDYLSQFGNQHVGTSDYGSGDR